MTKYEEQIELQQKNDIRAVMSTENGRRFVWRLLSYCGVYRDIEGEGGDVFRQIGKRTTGLYLLGIVSDVDQEAVFNMMKEAAARAEEEKRELEKERRLQELDGLTPVEDLVAELL